VVVYAAATSADLRKDADFAHQAAELHHVMPLRDALLAARELAGKEAVLAADPRVVAFVGAGGAVARALPDMAREDAFLIKAVVAIGQAGPNTGQLDHPFPQLPAVTAVGSSLTPLLITPLHTLTRGCSTNASSCPPHRLVYRALVSNTGSVLGSSRMARGYRVPCAALRAGAHPERLKLGRGGGGGSAVGAAGGHVAPRGGVLRHAGRRRRLPGRGGY